MVRLVATLALGASLVGGSDIVSAGEALKPTSARLVLAQELDASAGVVAWQRDGATTARALRWQGGRWRTTTPGPLRIRALEPRPGSTIGRAPAYVHIRVTSAAVSGPFGVWLDGRPLKADFAANLEWYFVLREPRPGPHSVVVFVGGERHAAARAWDFRVR